MTENWSLEIERNRKKIEKGKCPLCNGNENAQHILLECPATEVLRSKRLLERLLESHHNITFIKMINNHNKKNIKNVAKLLFKIKSTGKQISERFNEKNV